jgi:hypothetical protein
MAARSGVRPKQQIARKDSLCGRFGAADSERVRTTVAKALSFLADIKDSRLLENCRAGPTQVMPTLFLLPWCRLDGLYSVGPVSLLPYRRGKSLADIEAETAEAILSILGDFVGIDDKPITECALLTLRGRLLLEDYPVPGDLEDIADHVHFACLASLSARDFLGRAEPYCNADCFALYVRSFRKGFGPSSPPIRGIDDTPTGLGGRGLKVYIPVCAAAVVNVPLDGRLFAALGALRERLFAGGKIERWIAWKESLFCFNQANTDTGIVPLGMRCVLIASAIQRLLGANSKANDFGSRFAEALIPNSDAAEHRQILERWAREFYRIRGDYAHGRLRSHKPISWNPESHLLCGAIAFPLLVKNLLQRDGVYNATLRNRAEVAAFAHLVKDLSDPVSRLRSWYEYIGEAES